MSRALLTSAEEARLARCAQAGDVAARNELVVRNLPLVRYTLRRYVDYASQRQFGEDLYQVGAEALVHAADLYRPQAGRFANYAVLWIRARAWRWLLDNASVVRARVREDGLRAYHAIDASTHGPHQDASPEAGPEEEVLLLEVGRLVEQTLLQFNARQQVVLRQRLLAYPPDTLQEVGDSLGLSRERVRQLECALTPDFERRLRKAVLP